MTPPMTAGLPVLIQNARVLTMLAPGESPREISGRRQGGLSTLGVQTNTDVLLHRGEIAAIGPSGTLDLSDVQSNLVTIDARERVLMPGFVDAHTHACFAGERIGEWEQKLAGASYLDILKAGGGIMSTVRAVRAATEGELACDLIGRLDQMLRLGTTTAEVKSGYGLDTATELKMLRAIEAAAKYVPTTVVPTALLAHAIDPSAESAHAFVNGIIEHTLPAITAAYPGIAVDAYCETAAWSVADTERLFQAARRAGHPIRVHTDQFNDLGMTAKAIALGARTVDHLEASTGETVRVVGASSAFAVLLPACGFHLDGRYARGRALVDAGAQVVLATNFNPGSAPCPNMAMVIALAVRHLGLTAAEAIVASTLNAARALGFKDRGYIAPGARADVILLDATDERVLAYEFGTDHAEVVICGGAIVDMEA